MKYLASLLLLLMPANAWAFTDWDGALTDSVDYWFGTGSSPNSGKGTWNMTWDGTPAYIDLPAPFVGKSFDCSSGNNLGTSGTFTPLQSISVCYIFVADVTFDSLAASSCIVGSRSGNSNIFELRAGTDGSLSFIVGTGAAAPARTAPASTVATGSNRYSFLVVFDGSQSAADRGPIYMSVNGGSVSRVDNSGTGLPTTTTTITDEFRIGSITNSTLRPLDGKVGGVIFGTENPDSTERAILFAGPQSGSAAPVLLFNQRRQNQ